MQVDINQLLPNHLVWYVELVNQQSQPHQPNVFHAPVCHASALMLFRFFLSTFLLLRSDGDWIAGRYASLNGTGICDPCPEGSYQKVSSP
jgi:hypothetical protein